MEDNTNYIAKKALKRYFGPSVAAAVIYKVMLTLNTILLSKYLGSEVISIFVLVLPLWLLFDVIFYSAGNVITREFMAAMGENNKALATYMVNVILSTTILIAAVFVVIGMLLSPVLVNIFGIPPELSSLGAEYIKYLMPTMLLLYLPYYMKYVLCADSNFKLFLWLTIAMTTSNIIALWIFLDVMKLGLISSLVAMAISGVVGTLVSLIHFFNKKNFLRLKFTFPTYKAAKMIAGYSSFYIIDFFIAGIIITLINKTLNDYYSPEILAINLLIISFCHYTIIPIGVGALGAVRPLVSTFYGEHNREGAIKSFNLTIKWGLYLCIILIALGAIYSIEILDIFSFKYSQHIDMASFAICIFFATIPFIYMGYLVRNLLMYIKQVKMAIASAVLTHVVFPLLLLTIVIYTGYYFPLWAFFGISCGLTIAIILIWIKLRYGSFNISNLLEKKEDVFKAHTYYLLNTTDLQSIEHYQEMLEMFLSVHNVEEKKSTYAQLAIGEIVEYAIASKQNAKSYIDIQVGILHNNDVRLMIKLDNDIININDIDSENNESFISLHILKNISKDFTFNRIISFNTLDIVI